VKDVEREKRSAESSRRSAAAERDESDGWSAEKDGGVRRWGLCGGGEGLLRWMDGWMAGRLVTGG